MNYEQLAERERIEKVIATLKANNIEAEMVETGAEAKERVLSMIPEGARVMTMTSVTVDSIGLADELNKSGRYDAVRDKLYDPGVSEEEKKILVPSSQYATGSVHAVTEDGQLVIASNTGSQLPAYAYGVPHVIWVVGTHKIVKDLREAMDRIYNYVLPLESERAKKAYGAPGSNVSKMLVINKEVQSGRLHLVFVNEKLGY